MGHKRLAEGDAGHAKRVFMPFGAGAGPHTCPGRNGLSEVSQPSCQAPSGLVEDFISRLGAPGLQVRPCHPQALKQSQFELHLPMVCPYSANWTGLNSVRSYAAGALPKHRCRRAIWMNVDVALNRQREWPLASRTIA